MISAGNIPLARKIHNIFARYMTTFLALRRIFKSCKDLVKKKIETKKNTLIDRQSVLDVGRYHHQKNLRKQRLLWSPYVFPMISTHIFKFNKFVEKRDV